MTTLQKNDFIKQMLAIAFVGISMFMPSLVFAAAPIKVTGDISTTYERDIYDGNSVISGTTYSLKLMFEKELAAGWSLYSRLGSEYATQPLLADFNTADAAYGPNRRLVIALDQFGLSYKTGTMTYKLGRQDATVGKTALLYSRPYMNIGNHYFADGLAVNGNVGKLELSALLAREDNPENQNKLYAIRAGYSPADRLNYGLTFGRYQYNDGVSTSHWAIDGTYNLIKSSFTAEYTRSSSHIFNEAYAVNLTYSFDVKNSIYITGFRVESNADMGKQTGFDNDSKGIYYGITHKLSHVDSLDIVYSDQECISNGQKKVKLVTTFSHTF